MNYSLQSIGTSWANADMSTYEIIFDNGNNNISIYIYKIFTLTGLIRTARRHERGLRFPMINDREYSDWNTTGVSIWQNAESWTRNTICETATLSLLMHITIWYKIATLFNVNTYMRATLVHVSYKISEILKLQNLTKYQNIVLIILWSFFVHCGTSQYSI